MSRALELLKLFQESWGYGAETPSDNLSTTADMANVSAVEDYEIQEVIRHIGSKWVLKSKSTGKTLGTHHTKADAVRQEQAIKANQATH